MKLLADECCDAGIVAALRADGHDVLYALESLRGATDDESSSGQMMMSGFYLRKIRILASLYVD
jgi:hypothetical protein